MSVSDEERETLHTILDALINARNSLERIEPSTLQPGLQYSQAWSQPRRDLAWQASRLVKRVLGPRLHNAELAILFETELEENSQHSDLMAAIANSIRSFLPLFMQRSDDEFSGREEVIVRVIEDMMGIYWGDEPRFFAISPRRRGQHKRLYRLNRLRLSALDWDKYLAVVGMSARERHRLISDAYRTDWEAIRKWAGAVEEQYGFRSWPPRDPDWAIREFKENPQGVLDAIARDGDAYWRERSTGGTGR